MENEQFVSKIYATILKEGSRDFIWVTGNKIKQNLKKEEIEPCENI